MKRWIPIACVMCIVMFSACSRAVETRHGTSLPPLASPELQAIDSLMWQRPDSALMRLLPWFDTCCRDAACHVSTAYNDHYAHLLLAELLYKNDYEQTNRTELRQAVAYFDSLVQTKTPAPSITFLDARAHYINGVGYYERDSVVEACKEYLKALETMEGHFGENELVGNRARLMTYTYNRLGDMFEEQLLSASAIVCYKQALKFGRQASTSLYGNSITLYRIGIQFDVSGQLDSALFYYDEALACLPDNCNIHYRDIMTTKAVFAYNNAGVCTDSIIGDLMYIASLSATEDERITRFLTLGNILFEDERYDSSLLYLDLVFEQQVDIQSKVLAAENLYEISLIKGDEEMARQYSSFLASYTMTEIEKKGVSSMINDMFQDYLKQKRECQSKEERKNAVKKVMAIIVPIAVLLALVIYIVLKLRGKQLLSQQRWEMDKKHERELRLKQVEADKTLEENRQKQEKELRKQQEEARMAWKRHEEELESVRIALKSEQEALRQSLLKQEEQVDILEKALVQQREDAELRREAFLNEDICRKINDSIRNIHITAREGTRANVILSKEDAVSLREAVLRHYANFESVLLSKNPKMNHSDLQLCQLYLLGLDERQIAVLLCKTYSAIKKRANALKESMGITGNLSDYILKISALGKAKDT